MDYEHKTGWRCFMLLVPCGSAAVSSVTSELCPLVVQKGPSAPVRLLSEYRGFSEPSVSCSCHRAGRPAVSTPSVRWVPELEVRCEVFVTIRRMFHTEESSRAFSCQLSNNAYLSEICFWKTPFILLAHFGITFSCQRWTIWLLSESLYFIMSQIETWDKKTAGGEEHWCILHFYQGCNNYLSKRHRVPQRQLSITACELNYWAGRKRLSEFCQLNSDYIINKNNRRKDRQRCLSLLETCHSYDLSSH